MNPIRRFALSWLPIASAFTALSATPSVPAAGVQGATPPKPLAVRLELVPKLTVEGVPGSTSVVERAERLAGPWTAWTNVVINAEGSVLVDLSPGASTRFYRAVVDVKPIAPEGFVWIPAGNFTMGSPAGESGRRPEEVQFPVVISQGFWLSDHEVTQAEYQAVMGANPSSFQGDDSRPVEQVSWNDAVLYCQKLTERERAAGRISARQQYRLPTEAEWEYAARAGTTGPLHGEVSAIAWWRGNSGNQTQPVKRKTPNAWGLHDMIGNVREWCSDWYGAYPREWNGDFPRGPVLDPSGVVPGTARVCRGGGWSRSTAIRLAERDSRSPGAGISDLGFRPALSDIVPPVIVTQPTSIRATRGGGVQLVGAALGTGPLSYQWQFNGADLDGAILSTLTLTNVQPSHAGTYRLVVGNAAGNAASQPAELSVSAPSIHGPSGFVWIEPGTFVMGSPVTEPDRYAQEVQRPVTISRGFWISDHEVTQAEYQAVMGTNPSMFRGDENLPVEMVQWTDATEYCRKRTELERAAGKIGQQQAYRLPTEAEWEYAARAGTTGIRHGDLNDIAWWSANTSGDGTRPVRRKTPNAWGLHDMIGNVGEWCADWYGPYPSGASTDPSGPPAGTEKVVRGGGWHFDDWLNRSAVRSGSLVDSRFFSVGFRPVLSP